MQKRRPWANPEAFLRFHGFAWKTGIMASPGPLEPEAWNSSDGRENEGQS